jgi:hypothetical protein
MSPKGFALHPSIQLIYLSNVNHESTLCLVLLLEL